ncbi:DUF6119 family protein [Pseudonocardia sp. CA-107938]|uniref:DUF6119 family protein n=1 Tax=Pseudonocardia sp. CA-107938 TaxID=3240021 RepID=UPI003D8FCE9D
MQLAIHMFGAQVESPTEMLRLPDDCEPLQPRLPLDFECVAAGVFRAQGRPVWASYLDDHFDVTWPNSVSRAFVLLAKAGDRWFAVTFGQGRHYLDEAALVMDFGLRVTANTVDPGRLRSMATMRLGSAVRHTQQRISVPSRLGAFDVDLEGEWVRSLGGESDQHLVTGMTGSRSLLVEVPEGHRLGDLHELLVFLLGRYRATDYQQWYPYLDWLQPIDRSDARVADLDARLAHELVTGVADFSILTPLVQPDDEVRLAHRIVAGRNRRRALDVLGVRHTVRDVGAQALQRQVETIDADGHPIGQRRRLREFLAAQLVDDHGDTFVLADGRWFAVSDDYLQRLDRQLGRIPAWSWNRLDMPDWDPQHSEQTYNALTARDRRWLHMDRRNFEGVVRQRDRVEVADLITPRSDFLCVKKMRGAGDMSHLFSQGSVSATLYADHRDYRVFVDRRFVERWPGRRPASPTIVYAIGLDRLRPLPRGLPFFSRVNICNHARTIRGTELDVAVAPILVRAPTSGSASAVDVPEAREPGQGALFDLPG